MEYIVHDLLVFINTLRPRQNGRYFADDIFKCIFLNENVWIPIKISLKFVRQGPTNNIPALIQIMAWRRPNNKPLSEPMMVRLPTHICVARPQWVKYYYAVPEIGLNFEKKKFMFCVRHMGLFLWFTCSLFWGWFSILLTLPGPDIM